MKRHVPLRRKTPLSRMSGTAHNRMFPQGMPARKKPLKKQSKGQQRRLREYYKIRNDYLQEHPACVICLLLGNAPMAAIEVHHARGRAGRLLCDTRYFAASCRQCRDVPHDNPKWAREVGLLSPAAEWNVYPR